MLYNTENEKAVSPVIGVILMVAITVILAAVIAAFVFGMAGQMQKTKVVTATMYRVNNTVVTATFVGGQEADALETITWSVNGDEVVTQGTTGSILAVGNSKTFLADPNSHITGVGSFTDGSTQVIFNARV